MPTADELQQTIKGYAIGMAKGNTTDLLGAPVDIINLAISPITKALGIYNDNPVGGSKNIRGIMGLEAEDANMAETAGSMLSAGGVAKAMIVGAVRLGKVDKSVDVNKAIQLSTDGKTSMAEIYRQTGAYADEGTKFKSVVSDRDAKLNTDVLKNLQANPDAAMASLVDLFNHDKLHQLYPELEKTDVIISKLGKGRRGEYSPNTQTLRINSNLTDPKEILSVLKHEVGHNVQAIEGFQSGGSPSQFTKINRDKMQEVIDSARQSEDQSKIDAAERFKLRFNDELNSAHTKYENLAGEQEARFIQATGKLSQEDLAANVLNMLRNGKTPSTWDTKEIPKILSLQERIKLIPGNK